MEHRWGKRREVIVPVRLVGAEPTSATGWLTDVSLSGAYVTTATRLAVMSQIFIEVAEHKTPHPPSRPVRLQGRVVRHGSTGLGVEWEEFASDTLIQTFRIATATHPAPIEWKPGPEFQVRTIHDAFAAEPGCIGS